MNLEPPMMIKLLYFEARFAIQITFESMATATPPKSMSKEPEKLQKTRNFGFSQTYQKPPKTAVSSRFYGFLNVRIGTRLILRRWLLKLCSS